MGCGVSYLKIPKTDVKARFRKEAQYRYGYGGPHFDINAWKAVLKLIKLNFSGKRFVLPKVGSGLAGGDWLAIRKVLEDELGDEDVWVINID